MELIKVNLKHLNEFTNLEEEFLTYNENLGIDSHYGMKKAKKLNKSYFKEELKKRLSKKDLFFYFAKDREVFLGYIYGYIKKLPSLFKVKEIGYLDGIFISKKFRGKKVASFLKKEFLSWLKKNNVKLCQVHVASQNTLTFEIYKNWGFKIDEYRLVKKI